jgi:hypothetical protein
MDIFTNLDSDFHVLVDEQYPNLIKMNFISYGEILRYMSILPLFVIVVYITVSFLKSSMYILADLY